MAEELDHEAKCQACGGHLSVAASSACHDHKLIDVIVECDGCDQILNAFLDIDEMSVVGG